MSDKTRHHFKILALTALCLCGAFLCKTSFAAGKAKDSGFADSACDPQYMESLESRAWLEAQREITQNQAIIAKPDSVLEYTCFDKFSGALAGQAEDMFSGNKKWGEPSTDMSKALAGSVGKANSAYDSGNFSDTFLGGQSKQDYNPKDTVTKDGYACDTMKKVWQEAQCANASGDFSTFEEYAKNPDKRPGCEKTADFQGGIDKAYVNDKTPWEEDPAKTYLDLIYPKDGGCGGPESMIPGIPVKTAVGQKAEYQEYGCMVNGCHFDPKQNKCVPFSQK